MNSPRAASALLLLSTALTLEIAACKSPPDVPPPPPPIASGAPLSSMLAKPLPTALIATDTFQTSAGALEVIPIHHAMLAFRWKNRLIYVDPVTPMENLPKADVIFITDIHPDHLDEATLTKIRTDKTLVVGPQAVADKTHVDVVIKNGESKDVSGIGVEAIPMYNLVRGPTPTTRYHDKGRGDGYVLTFADKKIYLSGDTECTPEMKALTNIDAAFLCMNLPYTMTSDEAATCTLAFKPKVVFPYHFQSKSEGGTQDPQAFKNAVAKDTGIDVRIRSWY